MTLDQTDNIVQTKWARMRYYAWLFGSGRNDDSKRICNKSPLIQIR